MAKLPAPPSLAELAAIPPRLHTLTAGARLWHVYFRGGGYPRSWYTFRDYGPIATARFDHHTAPPHVQDRRIYYAGTFAQTCVAEVFQARRTIDRVRGEPWLVGFTIRRDVTLLNLTGTWTTRVGASMAISTGSRLRAQRWSAAFYVAYPHVDGLWYSSSMYGNKPAVAFYERAEDAVGGTPFLHLPLSAPGLAVPLRALADAIGHRFL